MADDRIIDFSKMKAQRKDQPATVIDDREVNRNIYDTPDKPYIIGDHLVGEMVCVDIDPTVLGVYGVHRKTYRYLMQTESGELYINYYGDKGRVVWRGDNEYEVIDKLEI